MKTETKIIALLVAGNFVPFLVFLITGMPEFVFLTFVFVIWFLYCNYRTSKQRKNLVDHIYGDPSASSSTVTRNSDLYLQNISYDDHLMALVFFRRPESLYPEFLHEALYD